MKKDVPQAVRASSNQQTYGEAHLQGVVQAVICCRAQLKPQVLGLSGLQVAYWESHASNLFILADGIGIKEHERDGLVVRLMHEQLKILIKPAGQGCL